MDRRRRSPSQPAAAVVPAPAGFFRPRPPREPRRVFFFGVAGAVPSVSTSVSAASGSSGSSALDVLDDLSRVLGLLGLELLGLGLGARRPRRRHPCARGGLRVGFSASASAVSGSTVFARRRERRVRACRRARARRAPSRACRRGPPRRRRRRRCRRACRRPPTRRSGRPRRASTSSSAPSVDRRGRGEVGELALGEDDEVVEMRVGLRPSRKKRRFVSRLELDEPACARGR